CPPWGARTSRVWPLPPVNRLAATACARAPSKASPSKTMRASAVFCGTPADLATNSIYMKLSL
ncbi:hypothetical protein L9G16_20405, partial [Shewanella sp. A25]|nr:hypothetical protein [Shewanella shenzhenensis]